MAKEEIKAAIEEFADFAVENARIAAVSLVDRVLASVGPAGMERLLTRMTAAEALVFGRSLAERWDTVNADNAAAIASQKRILAKILTALINAGVASLAAEMN